MNIRKFLLILSLFLIVATCIGSVAANDDGNITQDSSILEVAEISDLDDSQVTKTDDDSTLSQTIIVDNEGESHNEMNQHTIRNAINSANDGDTIIINGQDYVHVHVVIDKNLTIKSDVGTRLSPCSSAAQSGHQGIFYLTSKASGTVIEGFNFNNDDGVMGDDEGYAILVSGASDVTLRNCNVTTDGIGDAIRLENAKNTLISNMSIDNAANGIKIQNSQDTTVTSSNVSKDKFGIYVLDSSNTWIISNNIADNRIAGIGIGGTSANTTVIYNNITDNPAGVNLTSSNHVYVLGNHIALNNYGVYVNCNVTKIEIRGNFFDQNKMYEVLNDYRVRNLIDNAKRVGYPDLEIVDNNYMLGYEGTNERPVYRIVYQYDKGKGAYSYDEANDVYRYVGENQGDYKVAKGGVFLRYVFEINKYVICPVIYYEYGPEAWYSTGPYFLTIGEIKQVKKGVYSISMLDKDGNPVTDLNSVPVTFYLNKHNDKIAPQEGEIYKTVMMVNGTATVRFTQEDFLETGNVVTAVFPTNGANFDDKVSRTFAVDDAAIPGTPSNSTISVSDLNTYPNSNEELVAVLADVNGNPIEGEPVTFKIDSNVYTQITDSEGKAKQSISISKEGTYNVDVAYAGDDVDYYASSNSSKVAVKKQTSKIISSNLNMIPKMAEYYSVTLKDESGNVIANLMVTFKVNGKTYSRKTNANGVAKVQLKFSKNKKTYKITTSFAGNNQYKAASKTNKITVKYSSKTAKLSAPSVTIPPKTSKTYTVTLKDGNSNPIKGQKVSVKVNGKTYTKKTNSKGQVSVKVKFTSLKTYKVTASYKGSKIYKKASATGKIKVAKTATKLTAPTISALPKEAKTYTVTLKTGAGKALSKQKVTLTFNGKTYTKTTNSNGQVSLSVNLADEKTYSVVASYKGTAVYKPSKATGKINVAKVDTVIESYNRTYSKDANKQFPVYLKDDSGNPLANRTLTYSINGETYSKTTDENGRANLDLATSSSFEININYAGDGRYRQSSSTNTITVLNETGVIFIDGGLPSYEIQSILDSAPIWSYVQFLGDNYFDISLTVNKGLNIYSLNATVLNAPQGSPALTIAADDVSVSNMIVCGNSGDAIDITGADNVNLLNNSLKNHLNESEIESYANATVNMPGYGVRISNSTRVLVFGNRISLFESGVFAENSSGLIIDYNTIRENNYGIKYGYGVSNTNITHNEISDQTGLYIMTVPEGPSGYGIFLNNSAVNVTINHNHIAWNHMGISLDANYSTGIVITQNTITDNVLEGIRFNAGYDLAENAVEPIVTDNAIYRNARGPSMMILGEMSANPEGIYGPGQWNDSLRLKIDPNWYGTNDLVTWDYDTGVVGYGTMCPRISSSPIRFDNLTCNSPGNYSIVFKKYGEIASNLSEFDMYATLNRGTAKETEVNYNVADGVGSFKFNSTNYNDSGNVIEISVGSLIDSTYRTFKITFRYEVPDSEIPA